MGFFKKFLNHATYCVLHTTFLKDIIIIYHGDCPDGFGGAWAAWKKFGDKAEYIPGYYNNTAPPDLHDKEIYFIDFVYPDEVTYKWLKNNKRVTVIDHHFSKEALAKQTKEYSFSLDHSGAVLAWKYFHPGKLVPKMLEYIEDRDLYKWELPYSRAIGIFIDSFPRDFKIWSKFIGELGSSSKFKKAVEKGEVIVKYEAELVGKLINEGAKLVNFEGHEVFVMNAPHEFASDIGSILSAKQGPFSIIWSEERDLIRVSLRAARDSKFDVSKLAAKYGGGGHKAASGFRLPAISLFPWHEKLLNKRR